MNQLENFKRGSRIINSLEGKDFSAAGCLSSDRADESFVDLFLTNGNNLGIAMGDIRNEDISVDSITRAARDTLRLAARFDRKPHQVLGDVDEKFFKQVKDLKRHLSLIYAWYEPNTKAFLFTGVGQLQSIIINEGGSEYKTLQTTGPLIGGVNRCKYTLGGVCLKAGDIVFMYTPSLLELINPHDKQKGLNMLVDLLRRNSFNKAKEIITNLDHHLKEIINSEEEVKGVSINLLKID